MSTELEKATPAGGLADQMQFAKALATAQLLPKAYQNRPGDILLAMEYGRALGLPSVATVLTSVHVIDGRPSMSAELMQALVRRAGHKIRVAGDTERATCTITRSDDPGFTYSVTFTIADAKRAGLLEKSAGNWKRYPAAMLQARAVSACCRQACADVLAGVSYVPEELGAVSWGDSDAVIDAQSAVMVTPDTPPAPPDVPQEAPAAPAATEDTATEADALAGVWRAEWLARLDEACHGQDLADITHLANTAGSAGQRDLVDDARSAWVTVKAELVAAEAEQANA